MNLSIFDNDGGMFGDDGASRIVGVQIVGTRYFFANMLSDSDDAIKQTLKGRGWDITNVSHSENEFIPGVRSLTFTVYANVFSQYTDQDVINSMTADLAPVLAITSIQILRLPVVQYTNPGQAAASDPNSAWSLFWSGLGIATPPTIATVLIGGVIVLVVMTKK